MIVEDDAESAASSRMRPLLMTSLSACIGVLRAPANLDARRLVRR
jgi:multidrug efflux pump subunit AcrB